MAVDTLERDLVVGIAFAELLKELNKLEQWLNGDLVCAPLDQVFPEYQKNEDG